MKEIEQALITAYSTSGPGWETKYENVDFAPTANTKWAEVYFMPNEPTVETLGAGGLDLVTGVFQVNLNVPLDSGTKALNDAADALRLLFTAGAAFTYNGQVVRVRACGRSSGRAVNIWYRVSVSIHWFAFVQR